VRNSIKCCLIVGLISAQASIAGTPTNRCSSADDIFAIAKSFIATYFPEELSPNYPKPLLKDGGDVWEVIYDLPEGMTGGAPTIYIDKKNCEIMKVVSGQ
jgi:hypothetical protein